MVQNLKTSKYSNGDKIPKVSDTGSNWSNLSTGVFCYYNNDSVSYNVTYGKLYDWYAVTDSRNICPSGWHVPSNSEWTTLQNYVTQCTGLCGSGGGILNQLTETGTVHWAPPNSSPTNESGFTAFPGGIAYPIGAFDGLGNGGVWWSSSTTTFQNVNYGQSFYIDSANPGTPFSGSYSYTYNYGLSVRCVKN